jgi:trehalose-phosphatase
MGVIRRRAGGAAGAAGRRRAGATLPVSWRLKRVPPGLWKALERAPRRLLILDYDGTLAPFREDRGRATMLPGIRPLLRRMIAGREPVAIVSGRPMASLGRLVGALPVTLFAEHGWERRAAHGGVHRFRLSARAAIAIARAAARAGERGLGPYLEIKRTSVVLHTRALPAHRARALERTAVALWSPIAAAGVVRLGPMSGGVELRASARDKGSAVRSLLRLHPDARLVVMVGDDRTDEDAFAALPRGGYGLRVGSVRRRTRAHGRLASPGEVREFLAEWRRRTRSARAERA